MFTLEFAKRITIGLCLLLVISLITAQTVSAQFNIGGFTIPKPKKNKPKTDDSGNTTNSSSQSSSGNSSSDAAPSEADYNKKAPAEFDASLNVGDMAIAVTRFEMLKRVKILGKSNGLYKTAALDDGNQVQWYKVNSVYPYFDSQAFSQLMYNYGNKIRPYLQCYAQKHNLELGDVTGNAYNLPKNQFGGHSEWASKELTADQPELAKMESEMKQKFQAYPNTYLTFMENPAIVNEIVANRADYMKCVVDAIEDEPSPAIYVFLDDIEKAKTQVNQYTPEGMLYLVAAGGPSEELLRAVSMKERNEWASKWLKQPALRAKFDAAWNELATAAAKKIPTYKPSPKSFAFHYPAGEKLLMNSFKSTATMKIYKIGTDTAGWDIQKDDYGLPRYRYKELNVYFRDSSDDHPYCRVVSATVKQDYAGGGTYNAQIYRSSTSEELFGCP